MATPIHTTALSRRKMLTGAAAGAALAMPLAAAASVNGADHEAHLLNLYDRWKALEAERFNTEMEARRLWRERPADIEDPPRVRVTGNTYYALAQIDVVIEGERIWQERHRESDDMAQRIAARMMDADIELLEKARPVLAEKIRRKDEWEASVGYQRTLERRDDISAEAWDLAESIVSIAPTTQAGFLAVLDVLASLRGGMFDPEDDCGDALIASAANAMEAATGLTISSLPHCVGYRDVR